MRALTGNKFGFVRGDAEQAGVKTPRAESGPGPGDALSQVALTGATNSSMVLGVFESGNPLGTIEVGTTCIARDAAGRLLGEFENRKTAIRIFFEHGRAAGTITVIG